MSRSINDIKKIFHERCTTHNCTFCNENALHFHFQRHAKENYAKYLPFPRFPLYLSNNYLVTWSPYVNTVAFSICMKEGNDKHYFRSGGNQRIQRTEETRACGKRFRGGRAPSTRREITHKSGTRAKVYYNARTSGVGAAAVEFAKALDRPLFLVVRALYSAAFERRLPCVTICWTRIK